MAVLFLIIEEVLSTCLTFYGPTVKSLLLLQGP
jgi:hypothetical protein